MSRKFPLLRSVKCGSSGTRGLSKVLTEGLPCVAANNLTSVKLLPLKSDATVLSDSSGLSRPLLFQLNPRVIQSDRNADGRSRWTAPPPEVDLVLSVPHASYGDLLRHLQPLFQYLDRPKIAQ
jgi:hypothetical protein